MKFFIQTKLNESLSKKIESNLDNFENKNYFLFGKNKCAFLVAHGTKDGRIVLGNEAFSSSEMLKKFIPLLRQNGVNKLYTINCYGGTQRPYCSDGIEVRSIHPSKNKIKFGIDKQKAFIYLEAAYEEMQNLKLPDNTWEIIKLI